MINIFLSCLTLSLNAQEDAPFSVYLIGDAGEHRVPGAALLSLREQFMKDDNSAVIFLGDNAYPCGIANDRDTSFTLESQLQLFKGYKGQVYFIPGNHDWAAQKASGVKALALEEQYVERYLRNLGTSGAEDAFRPSGGLPGPETVLLNNKLRVIFIDTQWFLHFFRKNTLVSKKRTKELFYSRLDSLLGMAEQNNERVLIAAHHPMFTNGEHSRRLQPLRFLVNYTPFQVFGLMGLNRLFSQDISQPRYKKMRKKLLGILSKYDHIIFASGHDHNLQYFRSGSSTFIVSGSGSKTDRLKRKKRFDSLYANDRHTGFFKLEFRGGELRTFVHTTGEPPFEIKE